MSQGYKLRLPDGSEIGPLSLDEVKSWYLRKLVGPDGRVLKPGGKRWVPLREVIRVEGRGSPVSAMGPSDALLAAARAASEPRKGRPRVRGMVDRNASAPIIERQTWRTVVGGALLLAAAGLSAFWAFFPDRWNPALEGAPWRQIALSLLALGLLLVRGWELGRKIARVLLTAAAAALTVVAGILLAQHAPREGFFVVAAAFAFLVGLVGWLAASWLVPWEIAALGLVLVAGGAGIVEFGLVHEGPEARQIRAWAVANRRFDDPERGVVFVPPPSWVALGADQTLVSPPPGTWIVLAEPQRGGRAIVASETPHRVIPVEQFLSQALAARGLPARTEVARVDVLVGALRARQATSRWVRDGQPFLDVTVVAKDGPTYWSLTGWIRDDGSTRPGRELEALVSGLKIEGRMAAQLASAVQAATDAMPLLTPAAAEMAMAGTSAPVLDPPATFHRALELAGRGAGSLNAGELQELGGLEATAYGALSKVERKRLAAYQARTRDGQAGAEDEDRAMAALAKRAVLSLPSAVQLGRLQTLYEKAIRAGAGS
jgi:hypothetical protein